MTAVNELQEHTLSQLTKMTSTKDYMYSLYGSHCKARSKKEIMTTMKYAIISSHGQSIMAQVYYEFSVNELDNNVS